MDYKTDRLMLDVAESGFVQVGHQMGRYPKDSTYLLRLKLSGFKKLRLFRRYTDGLELHTFFQHRYPMGVAAALVDRVPALSDSGRVFGLAPLAKNLDPYSSVAMAMPMAFLAIAIGE